MKTLRPLHVAHLISSGGMYGAEKWILAFLSAATKDQIKFTLINLTSRKEGKSEIVKVANRRNMIAFDFHTGKYNPISGLRLAQWAQKNDVDIFHSHGYKSDLFGFLAARFAKCKIMTTPHGWSLEKDFKLEIYEKVDRVLFNFLDFICPLSAQLYIEIKDNRFLRKKTRLILNGVDIDEVDSIQVNNDWSKIKNKHDFVVGYIGQLIERKNIFLLLKTIKNLTLKYNKVKLILIGDGSLRSDLEKETMKMGIESHVTFFGFRTNALHFLKIMDVLVLPSLMEGIPRCVMEAMAAEVPVIVSNIAGNTDLVAHKKTGLLFHPNNQEDLSKCILYIMENKSDALLMAVKAREKIEQEYSNHRMFQEYLKLYGYLVSRQP